MWEHRFASAGGYLFGREPVPFLLENPWMLPADGSALSVADGEGRNSVHLGRAGLTVTSFDVSPTAVDRARALAADAEVSLDAHLSDWNTWEWEAAAYDLVCGFFFQYEGPEGRARQFADMAHTLKAGGRIILHGYHPKQIDYGTGGPPNPENMYTPEIMLEAFSGWQVERLATYDRPQQSGSAHVGMSALLDFVARKPA